MGAGADATMAASIYPRGWGGGGTHAGGDIAARIFLHGHSHGTIEQRDLGAGVCPAKRHGARTRGWGGGDWRRKKQTPEDVITSFC